MDEQRVSRVIRLIGDYCERMQELRQRRIGKMSSAEFWNALVAANKAIKTADDPDVKSRNIGLKHIWLNPDVLRSELGALEALMDALASLLDPEVLAEIKSEGYDSNRIRTLVEKGGKMVEQAKSYVGAWENAYGRLLAGQAVKADELSQLEYKIAMVHGLEDALNKQEAPAAARVTQHPAFMSHRGLLGLFTKRAAAVLLLAGASAILTGTGTPAAYGQETSVSAKAQEISTSEELSEKSIEDFMKYDGGGKILADNTNLPRTTVHHVTFDSTGKSNYFKILQGIKEDGALVVIYDDLKISNYEKRDAIIAKIAAAKFNLPIIAYNLNGNRLEKGIRPDPKESISIPSIMLASRYDLLKGETKENNDGQMKIIDVIRGGPGDNTGIIKWIKNTTKYWISTNVTESNGKHVWRANNSESNKWFKIEYSK